MIQAAVCGVAIHKWIMAAKVIFLAATNPLDGMWNIVPLKLECGVFLVFLLVETIETCTGTRHRVVYLVGGLY